VAEDSEAVWSGFDPIAGQRERVSGVVGVRVVHDDLFDGDVGGSWHFEAEAGLHHAVFAVGAEDDRFAMADVDHPVFGALLAQWRRTTRR